MTEMISLMSIFLLVGTVVCGMTCRNLTTQINQELREHRTKQNIESFWAFSKRLKINFLLSFIGMGFLLADILLSVYASETLSASWVWIGSAFYAFIILLLANSNLKKSFNHLEWLRTQAI